MLNLNYNKKGDERKMKLKKWVEITLMIIMLVSVLFIGADFESIKTFILSKLVSAIGTVAATARDLLDVGRLCAFPLRVEFNEFLHYGCKVTE